MNSSAVPMPKRYAPARPCLSMLLPAPLLSALVAIAFRRSAGVLAGLRS